MEDKRNYTHLIKIIKDMEAKGLVCITPAWIILGLEKGTPTTLDLIMSQPYYAPQYFPLN